MSNPNNVNVITLRSGEELQVSNQAEKSDSAGKSGFEAKTNFVKKLDDAEPVRIDSKASITTSKQSELSVSLPFPN